MPFMTNGKRDYKKEANWEKTKNPQRLRDRVERHKARRELAREGLVKKGDGKHVDHKRPLDSGGSNSRSNLRVTSAKANLKKEVRRKRSIKGNN